MDVRHVQTDERDRGRANRQDVRPSLKPHGSEFDLKTGEPGALPATVPVPVYEVSIEDGTVYLELEDT